MRDNKVFQLGVARDCGLLIPLTLVGTNHEDLAAFITTNSRDGHETIVKPLVPTMWSRSDGTKVTLAVSIVTLGDLEEADVSSEPLIYQRRVQKAYEVRLTVMGQMMFAVKLESQAHPDSQLDFRNAKDWRVLGHELIVIPNDIRVKIRRFCDRLQTPFGTMDFIVTIDDDWVFLESNTMGNFLWMEDCNPQIPLLDCFTEFLCSKDPMFKYVPETNGSLCRFSEFQADREFMLAFEKDDIQHVRYEFPFIVED